MRPCGRRFGVRVSVSADGHSIRHCRAERRLGCRGWLALVGFAAWLMWGQPVAAPGAVAPDEASRPANRAEGIRSLTARLGVGEGAVIVDLGAGRGHDTWLFADVVGPTGKVYAQDIADRSIASLREAAEKRDLAQVETILGRSDDPRLPEAAADLVYMRQVYHHFSNPREMLRGILRGLKPGGYLVVVDRHRGTLRNWVPVEVRQRQHHWTAETTVVREAREEGFAFAGYAEEVWHEKEPFVLVFQRPDAPSLPDGDPDPFLPLAEDAAGVLLGLSDRQPCERPVFIALGEARNLIGPILEQSSGPGLDIVLHEWATQKDERPPLPAGVELPSVLALEGDPDLGPEPIDAVFFLDSYHLLFHGQALLANLRERLAPGGTVYILDRKATEPLSRREASHHRKIETAVVREDMEAAGFSLRAEAPAPAEDRFLMVFGKAEER